MKFTVAIDGPAAAGKGTISRAVAAKFGFAYLDTGSLYRAVGVKALEVGRGVIDPVIAAQLAGSLSQTDLDRGDLRTAMAGQAASKVAAIPEVRAALLEFQKTYARRDGGAVLDGRDIGTVICPEAEVKIYVTASDEIRAERRHKELVQAKPELTVAQVLNDLRARDDRDAARDIAPMKPADDALVLDTSDMDIAEAIKQALTLVRSVYDGT
ncbi:MAG: cytidylate kinase [Rhodobacteraceae bacterium]|nr:MAG: cytidylate kinase [Paracoccaceae bacterium]